MRSSKLVPIAMKKSRVMVVDGFEIPFRVTTATAGERDERLAHTYESLL